MTLTHYRPDDADTRGAERGAPVHHPVPSDRPDGPVGPSAVAMANDRHRAVLAFHDTVARRTRKGRRTFKVTRRSIRWVVGADPVRETLALAEHGIVGDVDGVRMTGETLAHVADAWIRAFAPWEVSVIHGGTRPCVCDDLTVPSLVLDRSDAHAPVYNPSTGSYDVREVPVRTCHCSPFPAMLGSDLGRMWEDMTPDPYSGVARTGVNQRRQQARAKHRPPAHLSRAYGVTPRTPSIGPDLDAVRSTIVDRLASSTDPVVTIRDFPDVTVTIRTNPDGRHNVRLTRPAGTVSFRARTVDVIARRVTAG